MTLKQVFKGRSLALLLARGFALLIALSPANLQASLMFGGPQEEADDMNFTDYADKGKIKRATDTVVYYGPNVGEDGRQARIALSFTLAALDSGSSATSDTDKPTTEMLADRDAIPSLTTYETPEKVFEHFMEHVLQPELNLPRPSDEVQRQRHIAAELGKSIPSSYLFPTVSSAAAASASEPIRKRRLEDNEDGQEDAPDQKRSRNLEGSAQSMPGSMTRRMPEGFDTLDLATIIKDLGAEKYDHATFISNTLTNTDTALDLVQYYLSEKAYLRVSFKKEVVTPDPTCTHAKSLNRFDPHDHDISDILERWFRSHLNALYKKKMATTDPGMYR